MTKSKFNNPVAFCFFLVMFAFFLGTMVKGFTDWRYAIAAAVMVAGELIAEAIESRGKKT